MRRGCPGQAQVPVDHLHIPGCPAQRHRSIGQRVLPQRRLGVLADLHEGRLPYLLTELPGEFAQFRGRVRRCVATVTGHDWLERWARDLAWVGGAVGRCGRGDRGPWEPYRLLDAAGAVVIPVAEYQGS